MSAPSTPAPAFPLFRLLVITGAIFVSVTSEFLPTGLLPDMAADLGVSESRIGLLVTAFAATVVISTAPLAVLTRRLSRKRLMVALLLVFAAANLGAALAPTYEVVLVARILGGLAHGLFWAVTGPYATHLVPRSQLGRAVAVTNIGGTAAFVAGVPLATSLGQALGWRLSFGVMSGVVLIFTALVIRFLPPVAHRVPTVEGEVRPPLRTDPTLRAVVVLCLTVILYVGGHNTFYTYIVLWLTQVAEFAPASIGPLLFGFGAAGAIGLALAGFFADRIPRAWTIAILTVSAGAVSMLALGSTVPWMVISMFLLWAVFFGGFPAVMQARLLTAASRRVRDVASASLTTSFNLAIGGGSLLGGVLLDRRGVEVLPWAQVTLLVGTIAVVLLVDRRAQPAPGAPAEHPVLVGQGHR